MERGRRHLEAKHLGVHMSEKPTREGGGRTADVSMGTPSSPAGTASAPLELSSVPSECQWCYPGFFLAVLLAHGTSTSSAYRGNQTSARGSMLVGVV
ncbi:hypothetical protein NHX12_011195 [Muraenolepis orangiensis]|uniref:Uncharacterized protein n=1 Tax=Muraenolepis orangiensis TaxID=630683 RepID=A0A9Q0DHD4_9TELE|nr:hypothetical protein NHX12_011195 [Muraenolepis orangiensis]